MEHLTNRHIQTAERNRTVALAHLNTQSHSVRPPAFEWAAVIAFCAAVHYVNALTEAGLSIERFAEPRLTGIHAERRPIWAVVPGALVARCRKATIA